MKGRTTIRFEPEVYERLQTEATERMFTINWLVNRLVRDGLDRLVPIEDFQIARSPE